MTQIQILVTAITGYPGTHTTFIHALLQVSPFGSMDGEDGCVQVNWKSGKIVGECMSKKKLICFYSFQYEALVYLFFYLYV
jgi:hypothetical protein